MSDESKPDSEMYVTDVVPDGPETHALISIKRIKAGELTEENIGQYLGCHDPQAGANYGAKIKNIIRQEEHRNPGMLVWVRHPTVPGGRAAGEERMRLHFDHEVELFEMMAW